MRIVGIDLETTGFDLEKDRIVELAMYQIGVADCPQIIDMRFNPGIPIPPDAAAVHGISNEDVEHCPAFEERAQMVQEALFGSILCGYNIRRFDVPILDRQLRECDQAGIDFERVREIDVFRTWLHLEPRSLMEAVRRFAPHMAADAETEAHGAGFDARASLEVLRGQMDEFGLSVEEMEAITRPDDEVDRFGKFKYDDDGQIVFAFGKHKGKPAMSEQSYLAWMIRADTSFHPHVKAIIREMLYHQPSAL